MTRATHCAVCGALLVRSPDVTQKKFDLRKLCGKKCVAEQHRRFAGRKARDRYVKLEDSASVDRAYRDAFGARAAYADIAVIPAPAATGGATPRPHDFHTRPVSRDWRRTGV